jgi:sorbitol/mannitol transport system permease protein
MTAVAPPAEPLEASGRPPASGEGKWRRRAPLLPALIFAIIVTQLPFLGTLGISTLHWNILRPGELSFAGLGNYGTVFTDARLRAAVVNTVVLTTSVVVLSVLIGLVLAVLLDRKFPGRGVARTLLIAPFLVMPVAAALIWKHAIYNPTYGLLNGTLNWIAGWFGGQGTDDRLGLDVPDGGARGRAGLAVDAVHDADPAGRAAVPAR